MRVSLTFFSLLLVAFAVLARAQDADLASRSRLRSHSNSVVVGRAAQQCKSTDDCNRNSFCSFGRCRRKQGDGQACTTSKACFSGSCDVRAKMCASQDLSNNSRCSSSSICKSGNCQDGYCAPKRKLNKPCQKNSNCYSSYCSRSTNRCAKTSTSEPPELQPAVPWSLDLKDLSNLDPSPSTELFFLDSGARDWSVSQVFATIKAKLNMPAIVTSHSSFIGDPKCESASVSSTGGAGIELPFSDARSYYYAKKSWTKIAGQQFVIVTHTDGCSDADKQDERTFWLVDENGLYWNDAAYTVDVRCHEVAHQDVIHEVDINFGTSQPVPGSNNSTTGGNGNNSTNGNVGTIGGGGSSNNGSCATLPSSTIDGLPAVACGTDFDKRLDDQLGYLNMLDRTSFSSNAAQLVPGLDDYDANDYTEDGENFVDTTKYSNTLTGRAVLEKRLSFKLFKKVVSTVISVATAPSKLLLNAGLKLIAATPLGGIIDKVLEAASPKIDKTLTLSIKPSETKPSKNWGEQFEIYKTDFAKKNGLSGSVGLYCVDCGIEGSAHLQGQLLFSVQGENGLKQGYVQVVGGITAKAYLGLEANGEYAYQNKKNIATIPLGGFAIKDYVVIGPSMGLDAQFKFNASAEGSILIGAQLGIEKFQARLDLLSDDAWTQSGFEPKFTKKFEAKGSIEAEATLGLPLTIGFGIAIKPLNFKKQVAISTEPSVGAHAKFSYDPQAEPGSVKCNGGVAYDIGIQNEVIMDFLGTRKTLGEPWKLPLAEDCYMILADPAGGANSTTGGTNSTTTTPATGTAAPDTGDSDLIRRQDGSLSDGDFTQADLNFSDDQLSEEGKQELADEIAKAQAQAEAAPSNEDRTYVSISDSLNRFYLSNNADGSMTFVSLDSQDGGILFAASKHVVVSDESENYLVYYPDTLAKYGVSRFRIVEPSAVPKTTDLLVLFPVNEDGQAGTDGVYMPRSSDGNTYLFTMMCNYADGSPSKLFLAKDPIEGVSALKDEKLRYTVTGGPISDCQFVPLMSKGYAGYA